MMAPVVPGRNPPSGGSRETACTLTTEHPQQIRQRKEAIMKANKKKLELAMAEACMNSNDLAIKANMPRPSVNNVIVGRNVRPATIGKIAKALNVPVESILQDE